MKLWQKGEELDGLFEQFTVGKDRELDLFLAKHDIIASKAHAGMLGHIGVLKESEVKLLQQELDRLLEIAVSSQFVIEEGVEDVHSQIEMMLTEKLGDLGKKIHTGRSRNDQVLTALKLFAREELEVIAERIIFLFDVLLAKSEQYKNVLMPGYTHMQVAMPSSFGLWFGAYAECLVDDLTLLKAAHKIVNKNPLGSAAGYGSSFPIDRDFTTEALAFSSPDHNVVYAQMTRGKMERSVATALASVAATLSKLSMDICLYSGQNFDFFKIPVAYTTGSSIMPHKHNPDGFELLRARANQLQSLPYELSLLTNNLPSGYHRDMQQLKESFIPAFATLKDCLDLASLMLEGVEVNDDLLNDSKYDMIFSVELVNVLVQGGMPFRDAYHEVARQIQSGEYKADRDLRHVHLGSIGNLGNERIKQSFMREFAYFEEQSKK